ncbi:dynein regulatory complex protein 1-like isoform X2 [Rhodnius prolixus]|uniref:dynein regulatory complex protein 1-like isoform X2 n=1 Tax=Rhodnius prolixus TaxID=13249 RepID=UPI003D18ACA9
MDEVEEEIQNDKVDDNLPLTIESSEKIEKVEEEKKDDSNNFKLGTVPSYLKGITDKSEFKEEFDDVAKEMEAKSLVAKLQIISKIRDWFGLPRLKEEPETEETEAHIFDSMERLMTLLQDCNEAVSNVRLATLRSESSRLRKERENRATLIKELEKEEKIASIKYEKINKNWEKLKMLNDPLDIHNATNTQRDKCVALLERKDAVIEKLKKIIKTLDHHFLEDLRKQENEVNILIDRIDDQLRVIGDAYRKELDLIESVNAKEKEDQLVACRERWDMFIAMKNQLENDMVAHRYKLMEEHEEKLDNFILECQESIRKMTVEYFKKIRGLTMQVEEMRGICTLNAQKLKYNYNLLQKREEENRISKKQMLHKLSNLKEQLDKLKTETQKENKRLEAKLSKLKNELKLYAREITIVDKKADSLAHANCKKYFQLWEYNKKVADDLIKKILEVEKLFYEQQLCVPWTEPECQSFSKESLSSYVRAKSNLSLESRPSDPERDKRMELFKQALEEELTPEEAERRKRLMRIIFEKIADTAGFIREDKLETFMAAIPEEDKTLIRIDQVLKALGIENKEDMLVLTRFLMPYLFCKTCDVKVGSEPTYFVEIDTKYKDDLSDMASLEEGDVDILSEMKRTYVSRFQASCEVVHKEFCNVKNEITDGLPVELCKPSQSSRTPSLRDKEGTEHFYFDEGLMLTPFDLKQKHQLLGVEKFLDKVPPKQFKNTDQLCANFFTKQLAPQTIIVLPTDNEIIPCKVHSHELVMPTYHVIKALKNFMVDFYNDSSKLYRPYC